MYSLKDQGIITEIVCGNNFEYVLDNNAYFVNTDYKVLQSQSNGIFIKCMKMMRNGKTDLYYITDEYRTMSSLFMGITVDYFISIIMNLFFSVLEVRKNGFLSCQCIDLSWDKIFVETNTLKVKLVYLPLSQHTFDSYSEFESELRSNIIKLAYKIIDAPTERLNSFVADLQNGSLSLEDIYNKSSQTGAAKSSLSSVKRRKTNEQHMFQNGIKLVAMNAPQHFEIIIDKDDVLIGKKQGLVDVVIGFNNMISRKHCRIIRQGDTYYISDEGSANYTYVNGIKVQIGQRSKILRGDIVRLADSDFQVV